MNTADSSIWTKIKNRVSNMKYRQKLLLSLLFVFLVPTLIASGLFFKQNTQLLRDNSMRDNSLLFSQISDNITNVFDGMDNLVIHIPFNNRLSPRRDRSMVSVEMEIIKELNNYAFTSNNISDIALYYYGDNLLYYPEGTAEVSLYFDRIYRYENFNSRHFMALTDSLKSPCMIPVQTNSGLSSQHQTLLYMAPISGTSVNPYAMLIFTVDTTYFNEIADSLPAGDDLLQLYYQDLLIYNSSQSDLSLSGDQLKRSADAVGTVQVMENMDHLVLLHTSASQPLLQMVLSRNMASMNEHLNKIIAAYILMLSLLFFIGSVIIYFLLRANYKPVSTLLHYAAPNGESDLGGNELTIVRDRLIYLEKSKDDLNKKYVQTAPAYQRQMLTSLIKGLYNSLEDFNREAAEFNMRLSMDQLFCISISINNSAPHDQVLTVKLLEQIVSVMEQYFPPSFQGYGFVDKMNDKIIGIMCTRLFNEDQVFEAVTEFHKNLSENLGLELNMGLSSLYTDASLLGKAYIESLTALDYRIAYGAGRVISFTNFSIHDYSSKWYPEETIRKFEIALKAQEDDTVNDTLDEIMENLQTEHVPLYIAKYVCYDMMRILSASLNYPDKKQMNHSVGYHNVMNIARLDSYDQLREVVSRNINNLLTFQNNETEADDTPMRQHLTAFIDAHFTEYDFSMVSLVHEFQMSETSLRKVFKSVMQTTFIDYLAKKRIDYAKELLLHTSDSLKDIAFRIGYTDTSSFIRRFKQKTGMTPGEYRMIYSQEEPFES